MPITSAALAEYHQSSIKQKEGQYKRHPIPSHPSISHHIPSHHITMAKKGCIRGFLLLAFALVATCPTFVSTVNVEECSAHDNECSANVVAVDFDDDDQDYDYEEAPESEAEDSISPGTNDEDGCSDTDERCSFWADAGECDNNPNYMHIYCALSCNTCPERYEMTQHEEQLLLDVQQYGEPQKVEVTTCCYIEAISCHSWNPIRSDYSFS